MDDEIRPLIAKVQAGETFYKENMPFTVRRNGFDEETWFTFSWSPVRDERSLEMGSRASGEDEVNVIEQRRARYELELTQCRFESPRVPDTDPIAAQWQELAKRYEDAIAMMRKRRATLLRRHSG